MWMRIDDGLHAHRKTRAVIKTHPSKDRDAAPMGLWVLAGSWAARNNRDGWVPLDELDRFDNDWKDLSERLVDAGYWWPEIRDGEDGFGFNDWQEWNSPDGASASGSFGNHVRWHVQKGVVKPGCEHCPDEPEDPEIIAPISPRRRPDDRPDVGGESLRDHRPESLTHTHSQSQSLTQTQETPSRTRSDAEPPTFDAFWDTYDHKVGRKKALSAYRAALRKPGITPDLLLSAAASYVEWQKREGKHPQFTKHASTWLSGEHWRDERVARSQPQSRVQEHLALVQQLAAEEAAQPTLPQIGSRP
jgi:hypothetical protein